MLTKFGLVFVLATTAILVSANEEAPTPAAKSGDEETKNLPEWVYIEMRISTLDSQIKSKKSSIEKLIEEKDALSANDPKVKTIIKEIVSLHKEVGKDIEEYEKQKTILRYRFPERGSSAKRKYQKIELKSIDEIDTYQGVDGKLTKSIKKMRTQYGDEESAEINKNKKKKEVQTEAPGAIVIKK